VNQPPCAPVQATSRLLRCAADQAIHSNLRLASQSSEKVIDSIQARSPEAENLELVTLREPQQHGCSSAARAWAVIDHEALQHPLGNELTDVRN